MYVIKFTIAKIIQASYFTHAVSFEPFQEVIHKLDGKSEKNALRNTRIVFPVA